jgi:flagellar M-ring protein FliF
MDQLRKLFTSLSLRQRLMVGAVSLLVLGGLSLFVKWDKERDFKPLYSELSQEDAGAIVAKLREAGIDYRLSESDTTVLVPSKNVAELRLQMATAGIPKSGRIGYELFDRTNLGTTDFTEQVNYHRAVEGELERSVMALAEVEQARVHITFPKESVFADERQPAKASVMVKLKPGAKLSDQNAAALTQLVASAVEGLSPDAVSVMDMRGNLLHRPKKPGDGSEPSDAMLDYKAKLERETLAKIDSVLDPLLGSTKYRAAVDIDCDLTSGEQSEEAFDPSHSVITSSQRSEEGTVGHDTAGGGVPGTQSNLPRPSVRPPTQAGRGVARRSENIAYETSRTVRRMRLPQGIIRRMSVSVLVDQDLHWQMAGKGAGAHPQRIIDPPSPDRMKSIQAVVAAAVGLNTTRGDQLTVETQPFEATLTADPPASMVPTKTIPGANKPQKFSPLVMGSIGIGVLLLAGVGFMLFRNHKATKARIAAMQAQLAAAANEQKALAQSSQSATEQKSVDEAGNQQHALGGGDSVFKLSPIEVSKTELLTKQVHEQVEKDPAALARIVRTWLNESSDS